LSSNFIKRLLIDSAKESVDSWNRAMNYEKLPGSTPGLSEIILYVGKHEQRTKAEAIEYLSICWAATPFRSIVFCFYLIVLVINSPIDDGSIKLGEYSLIVLIALDRITKTFLSEQEVIKKYLHMLWDKLDNDRG
jgi:hypothetical protein